MQKSATPITAATSASSSSSPAVSVALSLLLRKKNKEENNLENAVVSDSLAPSPALHAQPSFREDNMLYFKNDAVALFFHDSEEEAPKVEADSAAMVDTGSPGQDASHSHSHSQSPRHSSLHPQLGKAAAWCAADDDAESVAASSVATTATTATAADMKPLSSGASSASTSSSAAHPAPGSRSAPLPHHEFALPTDRASSILDIDTCSLCSEDEARRQEVEAQAEAQGEVEVEDQEPQQLQEADEDEEAEDEEDRENAGGLVDVDEQVDVGAKRAAVRSKGGILQHAANNSGGRSGSTGINRSGGSKKRLAQRGNSGLAKPSAAKDNHNTDNNTNNNTTNNTTNNNSQFSFRI
jgi:hypothetical protein